MKKTAKILFATILALSMCVCAFALTLDTAENTEDSVNVSLASNTVTFKSAKGSTNVEISDGSMIITPDDYDIGTGASNFRCWIDNDGNIYYPGSFVENASALAGKTLTAVYLNIPVFDPVKGDLVYFFTYETNPSYNTPDFLHPGYAASVNGRWDGNKNAARFNDNGNVVLSLYSNGGAYQMFGYGIPKTAKSVGGKATVEFDFKYISPESDYLKAGTNSGIMRFLHTDAGGNNKYDNYIAWPASRPAGTWHHASATRTDTNRLGLTGGMVLYSGLPAKEMVQYIDNYAFYVYPEKTFAILEAKGSDKCERITVEGSTYTFEAKEGVVAYTDGTNYYKPGVAYNVSDLQFKTLYPFMQDASKPAVALSFEGDIDVGEGNYYTQGYKFRENIVDQGRSVFHIVYREANKGDLRVTVMPEAQFDKSEYNILSFMVKPDEVWTAADTPDATADMMFYAHINQWGHFAANTLVLNSAVPVSDKYTYVEANLAKNSNWNNNAGGYGFSIDVFNNSFYGGSTSIDYIRVYRAGITTVSYDTNAPEGATVVKNVAPDTGRGVGTGYLLKGERPEVDGYVFMGWALTKDAEASEVIESLDLTGDTTIYAVWEKDDTFVAPEKMDEQEIRSYGNKSGIRFKSSIKPSQKEELEEFGFIVTREVLLSENGGEYDTSALTFNLKNYNADSSEKAPLYVTGVSYDKDGEIDIIRDNDENGNIIYTAVMTGIPMSSKKENMVVRTYAKYAFGDRYMVVYGEPMSNSLYAIAEDIKKENGEAYAANKTYIDSILAE